MSREESLGNHDPAPSPDMLARRIGGVRYRVNEDSHRTRLGGGLVATIAR